MQKPTNHVLVWSGIATLVGGLIHIATIFGGPSWYRFIGAPERIVRMATAGRLYPVVVCLVIATVLFVWASFAFSGAGLIRRLPFLRTALLLIASVLIIRGIMLIPLMILHPDILTGICNCKGVDTFLVVTSVICLVTGIGYACGTSKAWSQLNHG